MRQKCVGLQSSFPGMIANDQIEFSCGKGRDSQSAWRKWCRKNYTDEDFVWALPGRTGEASKINGNEIKHQTAVKAFEMGLGMVHQHFMLIDNMTVWETLFLAVNRKLYDRQKKGKEIVNIYQKISFDLDVDAKISEISVGMKQRVEILKTLYRGAEIIILDEPTAVLTPLEVEQLLQIFAGK